MNQEVEVILPVLFWVLAGFAILNFAINLVLLYIRRERINVLLCLYWPIVLAFFLIQAFFQHGELAIVLAFGSTYVPTLLGGIIIFEIIGRSFPVRSYLIFYAFTVLLTLVFYVAGFPFEVTAMPFAMGSGAVHLQYAWYALYKDRQRTTPLQKLLACCSIVSAVHSINFALFRMDPGAQLWGWAVAYATYDAFAIIMPALALENAYLSEKHRLETLIHERTAALDKSLVQNRSLLKILLHDIHNPLSVLGMYISTLRPDVAPGPTVLTSLKSSHDALEGIVASVKIVDRKGGGAVDSEWVDPEECCREAIALCHPALQRKQLTLHFASSIGRDCRVLINRTLFVHSVLGNLLSNAIKFSPPASSILLSLEAEAGNVVMRVKDNGLGISADTLERFRDSNSISSATGTQGEFGMGLGLSIVKSIVELFDGQIEFVTPQSADSSANPGTHAMVKFRTAVTAG